MQYRKFPGMLVAALALLAACGAGCGGSSSNGVKPSTTLPSEQVGNTWNYNITGTATPTGGGAAQPVTGTATVSIISTTFNANPVSALQIATNISVNGGVSTPVTVTYFFQQDVNGNIIELGNSFTDSSGTTTKTVTTPSLANSELFPGTFFKGETISETINFTDATSQTYSFTVGAAQQVSTDTALFNTWPATITTGGQPTGTEFWDPGLGFFVKGNILNQANVGGTVYNFSINYSLTSTNVSGP